MATENQELALKLAIAIQDDNPTSDRIEFLAGGLDDGFLTRDGVRASLINTTDGGQDLFPSGQGTEEQRETIVTTLFERLFDRQPDQAGLDYWVSGGGSSVNADQLPQAFIDGSGQQDRATLNNKVSTVAEEIGLGEDDGGGSGEPGETFELTETGDNLQGTEDNDTFEGFVSQNQNGALANELATGDSIDGGSGNDTIETSMIDDEAIENGGDASPRPVTENVQNVVVEALDTNGEVTLDAARMQNVEQFWSDFSTTDFAVENVSLRGGNLGITKDITFGMRDVEAGSGLTAHFESNALKSAPDESQNSQLEIRVADVSTETPDTPLANVSLTLGFTLGGDSFELTDITSTDGTYQGLVDAMNTAFAAQGLTQLEVTLDDAYEQVDVANNTVNLPFTAREILVTDPDGEEFGEVDFTQESLESVPGGFLVAGNAQPVDPTVTSNLIESNLVLDHAGRGSVAGDVEIGGNSGSPINVEQLNVSVDRTSAISSLQRTAQGPQNETGNQFEIINISSAENEGDLTIQNLVSNATTGLTGTVNADNFVGDLTIGTTGAANVAEFSATGGGNVTYVGDYQTGRDHTIETGGGNDDLTVNVSGATSDSTRSETTVEITSGGGSDAIELTNNNTSAAITEQNNQAVVDAGAGADTITGGGTSLDVTAGSGNDTVYAENTGQTATARLKAGSAFTTNTTDINTDGNTKSEVSEAQLLYGREAQVTLTMPEDASSSLPADSFTDGYEVKAEIEASNGYLTTERDLYEAAAKAINNDSVANKLAEARVNSSGDLIVDYKVDGATSNGDSLVQLSVLNDWSDVSGDQDNIVSALEEKFNDSSIDASSVKTPFNNANGTEPTADQVAVSGTAAEFTTDLSGGISIPASGSGETLEFEIDGQTATLAEGTDFAGKDNATALAGELGGNTVTIGGTNYDISQVNSTAEINLTAQSAGAVNGGVTITNQNDSSSVTGNQTTIGTTTLGTDSATAGVNTVEAGAGDDVVVLSSNDDTTDTVDFGQGGFGDDTIVHYNDAADGDILDFSAWLDNVQSSSDSSTSEERIDGSLKHLTGSLGAIGDNQVSVTGFDEITGTAADPDDFGSLTDADVKEALNDGASSANSDAVGNIQKSILMVENFDGSGGNRGEYKVFEVAYDTDDSVDEFTQANLVGTADFGDQLDVGSMDGTNIA
ncbi:hypothetical protein ACMDCT_12835 [Halomonadaceae bacterium KBTZ08]